MGHSYISGQGKDLRFHDREIELFVYLIEGTLKRTSGLEKPLSELVSGWLEEARTYAPGQISLDLTPYEGKALGKALLDLFKQTENWVLALEGPIPKDYVNEISARAKPYAKNDIPKDEALKVIGPVIELLSKA